MKIENLCYEHTCITCLLLIFWFRSFIFTLLFLWAGAAGFFVFLLCVLRLGGLLLVKQLFLAELKMTIGGSFRRDTPFHSLAIRCHEGNKSISLHRGGSRKRLEGFCTAVYFSQPRVSANCRLAFHSRVWLKEIWTPWYTRKGKAANFDDDRTDKYCLKIIEELLWRTH